MILTEGIMYNFAIRRDWDLKLSTFDIHKKVKVKQSRYRPAVAQRIPGN